MGIVGVEDFPYYAYGRYPSGARRVPIYNSSFPGQWSGDYSPYYSNSVYGGNSVPIFVVEAPFAGDGNVVRKRKEDGLKGEAMSSGEHYARNARVEIVSKSEASSSPSKPVLSPSDRSNKATQATRSPEARQVHSAELNHSSTSSAVRSSSHPRVISIPITSMDEGKDRIVNCVVIPQEGAKRLRKPMSVEQAAVLIQARFRGTQVRNTLPLVQLRQISKVESQFVEFDEKTSDADFINYVRENPSARVKLTEGVMNLLLQLDAIQGAHPTVRDIRKLVTKKVITLQGRVDALLSQLPMDTDQVRGHDMNREIVTATESSVNTSTATPMVDLDEKEETRMQVIESDPDQERGEVVAVVSLVANLESVELEASRADEVSTTETNDSLLTMVELDRDQGNGDVGKSETGLERMELEAVESEIIEVNKSAVDEMERFECEADGYHESLVEMTHEDGEVVEEVSLARPETIREAVGVMTADVNSVEINTNDEGVVQSGNVSETSPQESLQGNEEEMEEVDENINGNLVCTNSDLSGDDESDVVHPLNEKGSLLPYSPRSPFDALECLDFPASNSDGELQSELQTSRETIKDESTQGTDDTQALILKLSEENKSLKSLLITVVKWNQMQSITMQELNHRLGKIESKVLPRIDKKSKSRRRRYSKSSHMML